MFGVMDRLSTQPAADEPIQVMARVAQNLSPVKSVRLMYRVNFDSEQTVDMGIVPDTGETGPFEFELN